MPEGHTLHRLAIDHRAQFVGRPVAVSSPQGRFVAEAERLDGRVLSDVEAYGKHLFYDFGEGDILQIHLGLFGRFFNWAGERPAPGPNVRVRLSVPDRTIDLVGATLCRLVDPGTKDGVMARLGPDPLRKDADPERAWQKLQRRKTSIGAALMDQSVFAGVGNVYRAELLAVHGMHPERAANTITREEFDSMWATLVRWLRHVKDQVIITVDPKTVGKPRSRIGKGEALHVYKQERCRNCGTEIRRWDLKGRWAYACEQCQPLG